MLTAKQIAVLPPGKHRISSHLYIRVRPNGSKYWFLRWTRNGKACASGLGAFPRVSRDAAREKAASLLDLLHQGGNPQTAQRKRQSSPTFEQLAREYVEDRKPRWKDSGKSAAQWLSSMTAYAFPLIGSTKIQALSVDDVLAVLRPLWADKHVTAGRVRSRISVVWRAARAQGLVSGDDPADIGTITAILPPLHKTRRVKHHSAIPWQDLPALWADLRANGSTSALALMWTIATVARTGATIGAQFSECRLTGTDAPLWTVKGERLKGIGSDARSPNAP